MRTIQHVHIARTTEVVHDNSSTLEQKLLNTSIRTTRRIRLVANARSNQRFKRFVDRLRGDDIVGRAIRARLTFAAVVPNRPHLGNKIRGRSTNAGLNLTTPRSIVALIDLSIGRVGSGVIGQRRFQTRHLLVAAARPIREQASSNTINQAQLSLTALFLHNISNLSRTHVLANSKTVNGDADSGLLPLIPSSGETKRRSNVEGIQLRIPLKGAVRTRHHRNANTLAALQDLDTIARIKPIQRGIGLIYVVLYCSRRKDFVQSHREQRTIRSGKTAFTRCHLKAPSRNY